MDDEKAKMAALVTMEIAEQLSDAAENIKKMVGMYDELSDCPFGMVITLTIGDKTPIACCYGRSGHILEGLKHLGQVADIEELRRIGND